jgi:hypothetical protein
LDDQHQRAEAPDHTPPRFRLEQQQKQERGLARRDTSTCAALVIGVVDVLLLGGHGIPPGRREWPPMLATEQLCRGRCPSELREPA